VAEAKAAASGVAKREGADAHWDNFIGGKWGDFHGRFCRWDPTSCNLLVETHLLRSYHVHEENSERFLRQQNKIFFDDGREPVSRGPWDVTKACSTECGIVHPRVGKGESGTTFLITPGSAQATAWAVHKITKNDPLLNPGVVPLGEGKGHEGQGYMVEMIVSHGEHVRLSIGYVSAQLLPARQSSRSRWSSRTAKATQLARRLPSLDWLHVTLPHSVVIRRQGSPHPCLPLTRMFVCARVCMCMCVCTCVLCVCTCVLHLRGTSGFPVMQQVYDDEKGTLQHVTFNREDNRGWPSAYWSIDKSMCSITPDHVSDVVGVRLF
jgi:hypothetical protein